MAGTTRPLPPGLLPSDEWLIQMLLDGRVDADIGGELGLSAGEVRERVALLASKLDVSGREGIRRYFGVERGRMSGDSGGIAAGDARTPYPLLGVVTSILVLAVVGTVSAFALTRSGSSPPIANPAARAQTVIAAAVSATAAAQIAAENPGGWYDAGPLFFVDGTTQPVVSSSVRALYTVVTLAGPGLIKLDAGNVKWSGSSDVGSSQQALLTGILSNDVWERVHIQGDANTRLLVDSQDSVRFFAVDGAPNPVLLVSAGPLGSGPPYQSTVGRDGRLLLDTTPVPEAAVINSDTGEQLDVSGTTALSVKFPSDGGFNRCGGGLSDDDGGRCAVYWPFAPLFAPTEGTLECGVAGQWDLVTLGFVLHFAGTGGLPVGVGPRVACTLRGPKPVRAGVDQIGDNATSFVITATTNDPNLAPDNQNRLSVAIGGSTMYVGPIHLTVGCPCMGGS